MSTNSSSEQTNVNINNQATTQNETAKRPLYQKILVIASMMSVIGGSLTGIMTLANNGYSDVFFTQWFSSFILAVLVMMPSGFILMTLITKIVNALFSNLSEIKENMVVGLIMALCMESIMAATTAVNNVGVADSSLLFEAWFKGVTYALPFGIVLAVVMTLTIKPRLQRFMAS